jgi:murein DD-endopeptidase MepM/ murein hydrolase activator NlpD
MAGFIRGVILGLILIGAGWLGGSLYPAPAAITAPIAQRVPDLAARLGIDDITLDRLQSYMSAEQLELLRNEASALAARAGEAVEIERDDAALQAALASLEDAPAASTPIAAVAPGATPAPPGAATFETALSLCPSMTVSNAPPSDSARRVSNYAPVVNINSVALAVNPTRGACLSSAFGPRGRGQHRGVDYYSGAGGPILAAGDGTIVERKYRDDYGNMLLIDHGQGVFTRYAHLSSFATDALLGSRVAAGQQIGLMGNTAAYSIPIHLHYEVLVGDYDTPRQSFGLEPRSPFALMAAR